MSYRKYCVVAGGNFGDDLNQSLWDALFPNLDALADRIWFYGIGTLLGGQHDSGAIVRVVMGSGIGGIRRAVPGTGWDFRWVRGLLTAREFGLPSEKGLGDAAILWPELYRVQPQPNGPIGLIPHHRTYQSFDWTRITRRLDIELINPKQDPLAIRDQIARCSKILTESLHGGIFADTLGVPWAPCVMAYRFNRFKWADWCSTIDREFSPLILKYPLVDSLSHLEALKHLVARSIPVSGGRENALRPIRGATQRDEDRVVDQLGAYIARPTHFAATPSRRVEMQRDRMLDACEKFAADYGIAFDRPHYAES